MADCHWLLDARYGGAPVVGLLVTDAVTTLPFTGAAQSDVVHACLFAKLTIADVDLLVAAGVTYGLVTAYCASVEAGVAGLVVLASVVPLLNVPMYEALILTGGDEGVPFE